MLHRDHPLSLTIISNSRRKYRKIFSRWAIPIEYLEWSPNTFLDALRAHSVALIPISTNPFTFCKSNNRLALALHSGLAVVADPIPSYAEFSGACQLANWEGGLRSYLADPLLRARHVAAGRELVEQHSSLYQIVNQWEDLFNALTASGPGKDRVRRGAG